MTENFEVRITVDGSPTLISSEPMHNLKGALSETVYVYGEALKQALAGKHSPSFRVASVGLGLGYNEWMTVAHFLKEGRSLDFIEIYSWEKNEFLRKLFLEALQDRAIVKNMSLSQSLTSVQSGNIKDWDDNAFNVRLVPNQVARLFGIDEDLLKLKMLELINKDKMILKGDVFEGLSHSEHLAAKFNLVYFDAFSSYTSPELWSDEFLNSFITNFCDSSFCVFASYASTSRLKRVLVSTGFELIYRKGFAGKRECTLAIRSKTTN